MMYLMWIAVCDNCGRKHDCLTNPAFELIVDDNSQARFERTLKWAGWETDGDNKVGNRGQFYCPLCPPEKRKASLVRVAALAEVAGEDYGSEIGVPEYDNPPVECDAGCRRYKQKGRRYCHECRATIDAKPLPSEIAAQEACKSMGRD